MSTRRRLSTSCESHNLCPSTYICSPGLTNRTSMMNHDCIGNAAYTFFGDILVLRARIDIDSGQEITAPYTDPMQAYEDRQLHLSVYFSECQCQLCRMDRADGQDRRRRRCELLQGPVISLHRAVRGSPDGAMASSNIRRGWLQEATDLMSDLELTYTPGRPPVRPLLYSEYRFMGYLSSLNELPLAEVIGWEVKALRSLGFRISPSVSSPIGVEREPVFQERGICTADAAVSCVEISKLYSANAQAGLARSALRFISVCCLILMPCDSVFGCRQLMSSTKVGGP